MNYYLIDYENVHEKGMNALYPGTPDDHIYLFYTQNASTISLDLFNEIQAKLTVIKVAGGSQSLDMHLISYLGYLMQKHGKQDSYIILSNDQGYDRVISFWINHGYANVSRKGIDTRRAKTRTRKKDKAVTEAETHVTGPETAAENIPMQEPKEETHPETVTKQTKKTNIEVRTFSRKNKNDTIEPEVIKVSPSDISSDSPAYNVEQEQTVSEVIAMTVEEQPSVVEASVSENSEKAPAAKKANRKKHRKHETSSEGEVTAENAANTHSGEEEQNIEAEVGTSASKKNSSHKKKKKKKGLSAGDENTLPDKSEEHSSADASNTDAAAVETVKTEDIVKENSTGGKTSTAAKQKAKDSSSKESKPAESKKQKTDGSKRTTINNGILKALSAANVENGIASAIASTATKLYDDDNNKQMIYRALVKNYGRNNGLAYYNLIKGLL